MKYHRRKFTSKFKSKVVIEAISEKESLGELALKFDLHRNQISEWKKKFLDNAHLVFEMEEYPEIKSKPSRNGKAKKMNEKIFSPSELSDKLIF